MQKISSTAIFSVPTDASMALLVDLDAVVFDLDAVVNVNVINLFVGRR